MVKKAHYIGDYQIPIDNIDSIFLNKQAYDVENPSLRYSYFSKTIKIPESPEVNKMFEHLFRVDARLQTFDPNLKQTYRFIGSGIQILSGYARLRSITNVDGLIYYNVQASGGTGGLYEAIGDALLEDLDFSSLDHAWTEANIAASWSPTLGQGYVYPMINYGQKLNTFVWYVSDFKPALFVKEYIDKIFSSVNWAYDSNFFAGNRFKSLIIPQASETIRLSETTIQNNQFLVSRELTDQTGLNPAVLYGSISSLATIIFNDDSSGDNYNTSGTDYNTTTGVWTVGAGDAGIFSFKCYLEWNFDYSEVSSGLTTQLNYWLSNADEVYLEVVIVRTRSSVEQIVDTFNLDITNDMNGQTLTASYTSPNFVNGFTSANIEVLASDEYEVRLGSIMIIAFTNIEIPLTSNEGFTIDIQVDSALGIVQRNTFLRAGDTMSLNDTIPRDIRQVDLLDAIIKRFNLYLEVNEDEGNTVKIEPLSDFITNEKVDLTSWVDRSREIKILPLGALRQGEYIFEDQEDTDQLNDTYQLRYDETYGTRRYKIDNDFQTQEKRISSIFAPTPLWSEAHGSDRIISGILFPRDKGGVSKDIAKPRLLYWGGTKTTNFPWFIQDATPTFRSTYPYAGHLDDPYNPTFDVNWGVPKALFYDWSGAGLSDMEYTDKNCFNLYWADYIEQITNKDSKILECYMFLDYARFHSLSFRKQYYIDGAYWRLLNVIDFDAINPKTTLCRFLKLEEVDSKTYDTTVIYGGGDGEFTTSGESYPKYGQMDPKGGGSGFESANLSYGNLNQLGRQALINSDNVIMGTGTKQSLVSGSDEAKIHARQNMLINSPSIQNFRSKEAFINSVYMEKAIVVEFSSSEFTNFNTNPFDIMPSVASDELVEITHAEAWTVYGGTAFTGAVNLIIRTNTTNATLVTFSSGLFAAASTQIIGAITAPVVSAQGEGLQVYQASDMGGGTSSSLFIKLTYRILKFGLNE